MRRLLGTLLLALAFTACDSANPVAPTGSVLTVTASPSKIPVDGTSTLTVQGFRPDGNALFPGTQVQLSTSMGTLDETLVSVGDNGQGVTTLRADGRTGTATVTAALAATDASATVDVQVGENAESKPTLELTASPSAVGLGESSTITVVARNPDGSRYAAGGTITIRTSLGTLASESIVTDSLGEADVVLDVGDQPGTAEVSATLGSSDVASVTVTVENRKPTLIINANPDSIPTFGTSTITVIARDNAGNPLGAGHRIQLLASIGTVPDFAVTNSNGRAEATYRAGAEAGTATVQAFLDTSDVVSTTIDIRDAAADISLTANPSSVNFGDATINLRALVRNAQNQAVPNINVSFVADIGTFETTTGAVSTGTERTNTQGEALIVLQVAQDDMGGRDSFTVTASVLTEGEPVSQTVVITINRN